MIEIARGFDIEDGFGHKDGERSKCGECMEDRKEIGSDNDTEQEFFDPTACIDSFAARNFRRKKKAFEEWKKDSARAASGVRHLLPVLAKQSEDTKTGNDDAAEKIRDSLLSELANDDLVSVDDAAKILGVTGSALLRMYGAGKIVAAIENPLMFRRSAVYRAGLGIPVDCVALPLKSALKCMGIRHCSEDGLEGLVFGIENPLHRVAATEKSAEWIAGYKAGRIFSRYAARVVRCGGVDWVDELKRGGAGRIGGFVR